MVGWGSVRAEGDWLGCDRGSDGGGARRSAPVWIKWVCLWPCQRGAGDVLVGCQSWSARAMPPVMTGRESWPAGGCASAPHIRPRHGLRIGVDARPGRSWLRGPGVCGVDARRGDVSLQQCTGIRLRRLGPGVGDDTAGIPHRFSDLTGAPKPGPSVEVRPESSPLHGEADGQPRCRGKPSESSLLYREADGQPQVPWEAGRIVPLHRGSRTPGARRSPDHGTIPTPLGEPGEVPVDGSL